MKIKIIRKNQLILTKEEKETLEKALKIMLQLEIAFGNDGANILDQLEESNFTWFMDIDRNDVDVFIE